MANKKKRKPKKKFSVHCDTHGRVAHNLPSEAKAKIELRRHLELAHHSQVSIFSFDFDGSREYDYSCRRHPWEVKGSEQACENAWDAHVVDTGKHNRQKDLKRVPS